MNPSQYSMEQFIAVTGASARTIRHWVARGLLAPAHGRGPNARYGYEQFLRVRVIAQLRAKNYELALIRRNLADKSISELEAMLPPAPPSETPPTPPPAPTYPARRWEHITLCPGVALMVATDAGPFAQRIAQSIYDHYAAR